MVNPWPRLPREVEDAPFQGTIKVVLDRVCEQTGLVGNVPVHTAFKGPFQPKQLHNPTNQAFISQQLQHSLHSPFSKGTTRPHPLAEGLYNNNCNIQKSTQWPAGDVYVVKVSALRSLLGSLGITKNSRTLVNITSLTHSCGQTQLQQHIKKLNVIWGLVPRCAEEKKLLCLQHRDWASEHALAGRYESTESETMIAAGSWDETQG